LLKKSENFNKKKKKRKKKENEEKKQYKKKKRKNKVFLQLIFLCYVGRISILGLEFL